MTASHRPGTAHESDGLIDCKVCDGSGKTFTIEVRPDGWRPSRCPCTYRRPCDLLCRCSEGPL